MAPQNHRPPIHSPLTQSSSSSIITLWNSTPPILHPFENSTPPFSTWITCYFPYPQPNNFTTYTSLSIPSTMVSLSIPFFPLTPQKTTSPSTKFQPKNNYLNPFHHNKHHRKVICACIAPPQNFKAQDSSSIQFNVTQQKVPSFLLAHLLFYLFLFIFWCGVGDKLNLVLWVSSSFVLFMFCCVFDIKCICYLLGFI